MHASGKGPRGRRSGTKVRYTDDSLPYPDGKPTEQGHFGIEEYCLLNADHLSLGTADNLVVYSLFSSKQSGNSRRACRAVLPDKFPEIFDAVSLVPPEFCQSLSLAASTLLLYPLERLEWHEFLQTVRFTWLCAIPEHEALRRLLMSDLFESTFFRYVPLTACKRVRLGGVMFEGESRRQSCILTTIAIQKDTFLWELNGILSKDGVTSPSVSTILPHGSQRMSDQSPRVMVGPARFVNHCCLPNAVVGLARPRGRFTDTNSSAFSSPFQACVCSPNDGGCTKGCRDHSRLWIRLLDRR